MDNGAPACSYGPARARRTASCTATGVWWRASVSTMGAWCSGTCCISARFIRRKSWRGVGRLRCSIAGSAPRSGSHCSPPITATGWWRRSRSSAFGWPSCVCAGRANGARAGWRCSCGTPSNSISSGPRACRRAGRGRGGTRCCWCWSSIDSLPRAVSGACIANGMAGVPSGICWARAMPWPRRPRSTGVTISSWRTSPPCSRTSSPAGVPSFT